MTSPVGWVLATSSGMPVPTVSVVDLNNHHFEQGIVGSPIMIVNRLFSTLISPQPFVCFFEVRDIHGVTQSIAWQAGSLKRDTEKIVGATWIPEKAGMYSFRSFAVSSLDNPESVFAAGLVNLYVVKAGSPITVGTGARDYGFLDYIDIVGRVSERYASTTTNVVIRLFDIEQEVNRDVIPTSFDGQFFHTYLTEDLDYGSYTIVANIEGLENQTATSEFTYGYPELRGIKDKLTHVELRDSANKSYNIGYAAVKGNVTGARLNDAGNYSLTFDVNSIVDDALVVQFPGSLLDKMTPLGDRDVLCITGDTEINSIQIASGGYGTSSQNATYYCPFSHGTSSITVAANTDPERQD